MSSAAGLEGRTAKPKSLSCARLHTKYLDNPTRSCPLLCMLDLQCLYKLASRAPTHELKEVALQKNCNALRMADSMHTFVWAMRCSTYM